MLSPLRSIVTPDWNSSDILIKYPCQGECLSVPCRDVVTTEEYCHHSDWWMRVMCPSLSYCSWLSLVSIENIRNMRKVHALLPWDTDRIIPELHLGQFVIFSSFSSFQEVYQNFLPSLGTEHVHSDINCNDMNTGQSSGNRPFPFVISYYNPDESKIKTFTII